MKLKEVMEVILKEFPIDVYSTELIPQKIRSAKVLKVVKEQSSLIPDKAQVGAPFIIDTEAGRKIACHPHIVGNSLEKLCLEAADAFKDTLKSLKIFEVEDSGILHILRAATGYKVAEAFPTSIPVVSVRTQYVGDGYRAHQEEERRIEVTFSDFSRLSRVSTLIVPDTFATGRSAEAALSELFSSGLKPDRVILYGFIAIPALTRLGELCKGMGMEMFSFAISNLTQLTYNEYDMPLYGYDESLYTATKELKKLGSIVDVDTLASMLPHYVAGLDQPGDWSERQIKLFNGHETNAGNISDHIRKSIDFVKSLRTLNSKQAWYSDFHDKIAKEELKKLREVYVNLS